MGQYWKAVNIDTEESVEAPGGIKLMEHSYLGNEMLDMVLDLLKKEWFGNRVLWMGDYFDGDDADLYHGATAREFYPNDPIHSGFILNLTKKEYVDLERYGKNIVKKFMPQWGIPHPLPLLTACDSNGDGGGDFYDDMSNTGFESVGTWFGDQIGFVRVLKEEYENFTEILPVFSESPKLEEELSDEQVERLWREEVEGTLSQLA